MSSNDQLFTDRELYIVYLCEQLEAMEQQQAPLQAVAYRLFARRLRQAMAGYPEPRLKRLLGNRHPAGNEVLANRYFEAHGRLPWAQAREVQELADRLLQRLAR